MKFTKKHASPVQCVDHSFTQYILGFYITSQLNKSLLAKSKVGKVEHISASSKGLRNIELVSRQLNSR